MGFHPYIINCSNVPDNSKDDKTSTDSESEINIEDTESEEEEKKEVKETKKSTNFTIENIMKPSPTTAPLPFTQSSFPTIPHHHWSSSWIGRRSRDPNKPAAIKKYKCDVCGKSFSRSNTLVTHKVT